MGLSKRQVALRYGFNQRLVETLLDEDVLVLLPGGARRKIDPDSLARLKEGNHYVVCRECGAFQAMITTKHLKMCCGLSMGQYVERYPGALLMSSMASANKAKTEEQKRRQSECLCQRFQTLEGQTTRQQISSASKRMHASGYQERAAGHLREMTRKRSQSGELSQELSKRWASGTMRASVQKWHREHREQSLASAAHARRHIRRKCTGPHRRFRAALEASGLLGFKTEHEIAFYAVDEAHPTAKIAVEIDGCYWHSCPTCGFDGPSENRVLDKRKTTYLIRQGWVVLRFWEHEVKDDVDACVERVRQALEGRTV